MANKKKYGARAFSEESYKNNDEWGISRIKRHLIESGFEVVDKDEEDYDVDIIATKDGNEFKYEAEVKSGYPFTGLSDFRFDTVSFLGRKKKFHLRSENGFYYAIVCRETEAIVYAHSSDIYKEEYRQLKTINAKHRKGLDEFYLVPKEKCQWTTLK